MTATMGNTRMLLSIVVSHSAYRVPEANTSGIINSRMYATNVHVNHAKYDFPRFFIRV